MLVPGSGSNSSSFRIKINMSSCRHYFSFEDFSVSIFWCSRSEDELSLLCSGGAYLDSLTLA